MNQDQIALELLVRNGFVKAAHKLAESSSEIPDAQTKLIEAKIYCHIRDMWGNEKTNANFGVEPERAQLLNQDEEVQSYFAQTSNAALVRDYLALVNHAVGVPEGDMVKVASARLLESEYVQDAVMRTRHENLNGVRALYIAHTAESALNRLQSGNHNQNRWNPRQPEDYTAVYMPILNNLKRRIADITDGHWIREVREATAIDEYDWLSEPPTSRIGTAVKEFESGRGANDRIFRGRYKPEGPDYISSRIVYWFGNDMFSGSLHNLFYFILKNQEERVVTSYDPKLVAHYLGKALEVELRHGNFKRASFALDFPNNFIDRSNHQITGLVKAFDMAVETKEKAFPAGCSMMHNNA